VVEDGDEGEAGVFTTVVCDHKQSFKPNVLRGLLCGGSVIWR
jgi:hypothetical protein